MKDESRCFTLELAGRIDVLHARYSGRAFTPHWHEEFAVGLVSEGVEQFWYRGATHRAVPGELILLNAGEVHTGESADERGFGFQMLYVPETTFREACDNSGSIQSGLNFKAPVFQNGIVQKRLSAAHRSIARHQTGLEAESLLLEGLTSLLQHASSWSPREDTPSIPASLLQTRDYIQAHLFEEVSLERLAAVAGLSKFHLLRLFRRRFGLPPHAYQLQERVLRAKMMLRSVAPGDVAAAIGFTDQSHFNRVFRSLVGTTPGRYAEQFRPIQKL